MWVIRPGLDVPEVPPEQRPKHDSTLRIVVYGPETRGQARTTDLEPVLEQLEASSVPVDVTLVGSHPEHPATLAVFEVDPLAGASKLRHPLHHDALMALFEAIDVVVASPETNALTEDLQRAMARGCVLVITSQGEARPQLLRDGQNGFVVGAADVASITDRLTLLHRDPHRLAAMSSAARETARRMFTIDDMAKAYAELFERLVDEAAEGAFRRPVGGLRPPAAEVAGASIFPVELSYTVEGVGGFPSRSDYRRFRGQLGRFQRLRDLATGGLGR